MKNPKRLFLSFFLGIVAFFVTMFPNILVFFFPDFKETTSIVVVISAFWGILFFILVYILLGKKT